ncbi:Ubiquinone biosynthesis monooxygenase COQ6, mitochondrial, partial [Armadillidium nasatum]
MISHSKILTPYLKGKRSLNLYRNGNRFWKTVSQSFCSTTETQNDSLHFDIVISGGGMVGFAAGCALGQSRRLDDRKILVLEKQNERAWSLPEEYSNRVCALNPHTKKLFTQLGAWNTVTDLRAQPVKKMQVWESCTEALITFEEEEETGEPIAHIVENDVILHALKNKIPENVEVWYGSQVSGYELPSSNDDKPVVNLSDGKRIVTDLLASIIGADGLHSGVRKAMKCQNLSWEYDQMGIVATLHLSEWRDEGTQQVIKNLHEQWQNLLRTIAPSSGRSLLGPGSRQLPPSICGIVPKSRASFPLGLMHAAHYVGPRVVLIGDAAHRVHPLAGQGVNLGFGDVACLLETLEKAVLLGTDIGNLEVLQKYETLRQRHNVPSMVAIDALYRLYSTNFSPIVLLRSLGLSAVDAFAPVKVKMEN